MNSALFKSLRVGALFAIFIVGCGSEPPKPANSFVSSSEAKPSEEKPTEEELRRPKEAKPAALKFHRAARESGLEFAYTTGATGQALMVESTGGGAGWLDFNVDGRPDVYFCQGINFAAAVDDAQPNDALFLQVEGHHFANVTDQARIKDLHYGQGVCVGDYNDDGFDDVFVTNVGRDTLWRNMGDGTFLDVTEEAGVSDDRWSSSAAFADLDLDGDLDLYCCHYCAYDARNPIQCLDAEGRRRVCHPKDLDPSPDECFFNQGDGTFRAEAKQRGLFGPGNKGLGVVISDFDLDGDPDIYVANDTTEAFFFENDGQTKFREVAQRKGCAVNRNGVRQANMGVGFGDFDHDGWQDFYITTFYADSNTLFRNLGGKRGFEDVTAYSQLHEPTLGYLGFGAVMQDFDQNGTMELLIANGHIDSQIGESLYKMRPQLFTYEEPVWTELDAAACDYFEDRVVGRGLATADYDGDGDLDALFIHQNSPSELLRNDSRRGGWLKCSFRGSTSNRRGIGCRAVVETPSGKKYTAELCGGSSYASTMEPCLVFGLGEEAGPVKLTVIWPGGEKQVIENVVVNQALVIEQRGMPAKVVEQ